MEVGVCDVDGTCGINDEHLLDFNFSSKYHKLGDAISNIYIYIIILLCTFMFDITMTTVYYNV